MALIADISAPANAGDIWIVPDMGGAQTFTVIEGTWEITSVDLLLYAFADPGPAASGNMTLNIREDSPTGDILGTSTVNRNTVTQSADPDDATWITFDFSGFSLSSGNTYCLELSCPFGGEVGETIDNVFWVLFWDFYDDGMLYEWDGESWSDNDTYDLLAKVNGDEEASPEKAINPTPTNANDTVTLDQATITWENGGGATSYNVYYGDTSGDLTLVSEGQVETSLTVTGITLGSPYEYLITRYWRVDSINEAGTTTGDEWSFTTIKFDPPLPTGVTLDDDGNPTGTPTGQNFMTTTRILVGVANNKVWFENI